MIDIISRRIEAFRELLEVRLGSDRVTADAQITKLKEEFGELLADREAGKPLMPELTDMMIVLLMTASCEGWEAEEVLARVADKMAVNLDRSWFPTESGTARHTPELDPMEMLGNRKLTPVFHGPGSAPFPGFEVEGFCRQTKAPSEMDFSAISDGSVLQSRDYDAAV